MKSKESLIKNSAIVSLCVLLAVSAVFVLYGWFGGHFETFESFRAYVSSYGMWGPVILTLIQMLQVILPVLPGFLGCVVGAILFGPAIGFAVNYIGICAGSIISFYLARRYGIRLVNKMLSMKKYEKYIERINRSKSYFVLLFLVMLLPLFPDDFFCYFSGLIDMKPKKFIIAVLLGKPWCILFYSIFAGYLI